MKSVATNLMTELQVVLYMMKAVFNWLFLSEHCAMYRPTPDGNLTVVFTATPSYAAGFYRVKTATVLKRHSGEVVETVEFQRMTTAEWVAIKRRAQNTGNNLSILD